MPKSYTLNSISSFYKTVTAAIVTHGLAITISFIGSVLLTRVLGPEGRGIVAWIISFSSIGIILSQAGMGHTNRRFVSNRYSRASTLFWLTVIICGIVSIISGFALGSIALQDVIGQTNKDSLFIALFIIPVLAIALTSGEMLIGLKKNTQYNSLNIAEKSTNTLLIILFITIGIISPFTAIIAVACSTVVKLSFSLFFLRDNIKFRLKGARYILTHIGSFTFFNYISSSTLFLSAHIIIIFLGSFSTTTETGWFAANMIIINVLRQLANVTATFALPRLVSTKDYHSNTKLKKGITIITLALALSAMAFFFILSGWIIPLIFGAEFIGAVEAFRTLLIGFLFCSMLFIFQSFIASDSKGYVIIIAPFILMVSTITLCLTIIQDMGIMGAAYSWSISNAVAALLSGYIAIRVHKAKAS